MSRFRATEKNMSLFLFLAGLVLILLTSNACATTTIPPLEKRLNKLMERLTTRLMLTEQQVKLIRPIMRDYLKKRNGILKKYRDKERELVFEMRMELKNLELETEKRLEPILTVFQMKEYKKLKIEQREKIRQKRKKRMF